MSDTKTKILEASKLEFMQKGFSEASLRTIAAHAGVTTGAIYGYYPDKHAIFIDLVEPAAGEFKNRFLKEQADFAALTQDEQIKHMYKNSTEALQSLLDFIYSFFDSFRLIICSAAGTEYEHYIDELVEIEALSSINFMKTLKAAGFEFAPLSENLIHILSNAYFSAIFETVAHNMEKSEADEYVAKLTLFFKAGWGALFGMDLQNPK